jgi:ribosomal protein L11 methyltransferase
MEKFWIETALTVPAEWVDLVCALFQDLGSSGVLVEERKLDTFVPPDPEEPYLPVCRVRAYFDRDADRLPSLKKEIGAGLEELATFTPGWVPPVPEPVLVKDEAWGEKWKQHFQPFRVGKRLVVSPSWEEIKESAGDVVLRLDPGMAFGTGTHPTTRLCLEGLAEAFDASPPPHSVLDVGTGSGILAMAAAALGAQVLAIDIDSDASEIARSNIAANGLTSQIEVRCDILERIAGSFDLIVANIFAEELIRLAPHFQRLLAIRGRLILSGILEEKVRSVIERFDALPLTELQTRQNEEWCCLVYRKS